MRAIRCLSVVPAAAVEGGDDTGELFAAAGADSDCRARPQVDLFCRRVVAGAMRGFVL